MRHLPNSLALLAVPALLAPGAAAQAPGIPLAPILVNSNGATDATPDDDVAIDADTSGRLVLAYTKVDTAHDDLDVHFSFSNDHGASWTPTAAANLVVADFASDEREPTVAAQVGGWRYVYARSFDTAPGEHDIYWGADAANPDGFSNGGALQSDATSDTFDDRVPHLYTVGATVPTLTSICVWQRESATNDEDVFFARNAASSGSWSATAPLHTSFAADVGRDRLPRVAGDGAGNWVCVWESTNSLGGTIGTDTDILYSRSFNDGVTWSAPAALNSTAATDGADSDVAPVIEVHVATGTWVVAWRSTSSLGGTIGADPDILYARSTDAGLTWSAAAALNSDAATDHLGTQELDEAPDLAVDGTGCFVAVWSHEHATATDFDLRRAFSVDFGATWSAPELVNTNGATDSGGDREPRVAASPDGHWAVAWISADDLGGTIGTDLDVLATRFLTPDPSSPGTQFCFGFEHGDVRCPCGNDSVATTRQGCLNSTGVGATAQLTGTAHVAGPVCRVLASGMPANSSALVFQGTSAIAGGLGTHFGDGLRCIGGSVLRIDTLVVSSAGQVHAEIPTTGLAPGDLRAYQIWYRNAAAGFCTSLTFNLSAAFWTVWLH